jgi:hypothetical protein
MSEDFDHPRLLPAGFRIRHAFFWRPVWVDGGWRYLEWVPIVQRCSKYPGCAVYDSHWHDVGYLDEVLGMLKGPAYQEVLG